MAVGLELRLFKQQLTNSVYLPRDQDCRNQKRRLRQINAIRSMSPDTSVITASREIRKALNFDLEARRNCPTWAEALRMFVGLADSIGVLVMTNGIVMNNTHRKLNPKEFRGFVRFLTKLRPWCSGAWVCQAVKWVCCIRNLLVE